MVQEKENSSPDYADIQGKELEAAEAGGDAGVEVFEIEGSIKWFDVAKAHQTSSSIWRLCGASASPSCGPIRSSWSAGAWASRAAWRPSCGRTAWRQACHPSIDATKSRLVSGRASRKVAWLFVVLAL